MTSEKPVRFGFLLLPSFTLTAFSGMLDVLRLASDEGDRSRPVRCDWQIIGESLAPVCSSSSIEVTPSACLGDPTRFDYLVVVGGLLQRPPTSQTILNFIRSAASSGVTIVGLCTGAFTLMQAGILDGYRICIHWFHYWDFLEHFPNADPAKIVADRLYVIDQRRITCSGGRATIDLAAEILTHHISPSIVQKAVRILQVDDVQRRNAAQSLPPGIPPPTHPVVRRAVLLMEQHISQGLSLDELTSKLGVSGRQLERLFKETMGQSPQSYARGVRLRLAAWMLTNTDKAISAIAMDCGFSGASHFGRIFRSTFHMPPSAWRERARSTDALAQASEALPDPISEVFPDRREFY
ncbi:GlxA family transcriptional regulator [Castellaniella sp. GW247-6E4]|uniref:GlxA family transcriptional regulator n=1 Tax=Castellaniella sp. GW247-6E4 TaxID=3140380 RepID=UPI0033164142